MRILLVNQAFWPDNVSSGQHAADLAEGLVKAGHQVTVVTGRHAYDDPERRFPAGETWNSVRIIRVPFTGFGKKARWRRAADFGTFILSCFFRMLSLPRFDVIIAMSSPPLLGAAAATIVRWKGGALVSWILDLNPDEAIAAGWLSPESLTGKFLESCLRFALKTSGRVFVMDRFMAARVAKRGVLPERLAVMPPWSHSETLSYDAAGRDAFRRQHGIDNKFVVMYSGNHSPCHPLTTLLDGALRLRGDSSIVFVFVGGGSEFGRVTRFAAAHGLQNIVQLPYQSREKLAGSLSSADLHVVVMGEPFVGIVHTCKVYNILSLGIPFLYIGPERSHIMDLSAISTASIWMYPARDGQPEEVVSIIRRAQEIKPDAGPWERAASVDYTQEAILPRMIREIEAVVAAPGTAAAADVAPPPAEGEVFAVPEVIDSVLRDLHKNQR